MSDPFLAEIRIFPFKFAPVGWATCDGQLLAVSQNTALFALLGTTYGGNGKSNFALPKLNGRAAVHTGYDQPGPGLKTWDLGEETGTETVALVEKQLPAHSHTFTVTGDGADTASAHQHRPGKATSGNPVTGQTQARIYSTGQPLKALAPFAIGLTGGDKAHDNMMPYLTLLYCISLQGTFPPHD